MSIKINSSTNISEVWGGDSMLKMLALKTQGYTFVSLAPMKKPSMLVYMSITPTLWGGTGSPGGLMTSHSG